MNDREFEHMLTQLMQHDFSEGTDEFRDALLAQCVEALDSSEPDSASNLYEFELPDEALDLISAAGDFLSAPPNKQ